jgi:hypothetical protein
MGSVHLWTSAWSTAPANPTDSTSGASLLGSHAWSQSLSLFLRWVVDGLPRGCSPPPRHREPVKAIAPDRRPVLRLGQPAGTSAAREGQLLSRHFIRSGVSALLTVALVGPLCIVAASSATGGATTSGPLLRVRSVAHHAGTSSANWSGYGVPGTFSGISGSWTVPVANPSPTATYSSTWIGIDGLANTNLIQTGTESDYVGGKVQYMAWWEVLPAAETVITSMTVNPGDHMSASINHVKSRKWSITLTDTTTGRSFTFSRTYRGLGASAEWIQERPQIGRTLSLLTDYGSTTFTGITANGVNPHLTAASAISMINDRGTGVISYPSAPSLLGNAFSVAYGSVAPAPPAG